MDECEQLSLFDMGAIDIPRLKAERERYASAIRATNTLLALASDWKIFRAWCRCAGRRDLPASSETVELFVTHQLHRGLKTSTVTRHVCSIAAKHTEAGLTSPVTFSVSALLSGARRLRQEQPGAKAIITPDDLRRISIALAGCDARSVRDRSLMVVGFATAMRRSELRALDLADVKLTCEGFEVFIRRGKTDQEGKGRKIGIPPGKHAASCPVEALKTWLDARGNWPGPLFTRTNWRNLSVLRLPLGREDPRLIVKRCVALIGLDPTRYGAHSLRASCVTAALEAGCSQLVIMERTGHRSVQTLQRYFRPNVFANDPLVDAL